MPKAVEKLSKAKM